ncbi:SNX5, partial [Cervus elaphus hippelaphus]
LSVRRKNTKEMFGGFFKSVVKSADELKNVFQLRSVSVDLNVDPSLQIDIPDALSERDKVKFTVHTKTTLPTFQSPEFSVTRQHEDFVWLHDTLIETTDYAGLIIPPAPTKPDFDGPREKMQKLGEGEGSMTKEEFAKMKQELEAIKDSCAKADRMTRSHKSVADDYIHTAACLHSLALEEPTVIKKYLLKVAELFEKLRKVESRVSSDEDLKLTELLRYYMLNIEAAKDLLYRRTKALIDYENSNKALDKARLKSKDLINFKRKRVAAFRKNLIEMSELEIKHARNNVSLLQSCIDLFKNN